MPCGATQDRGVMVEGYDKMLSTGEGNVKTLQYSCHENSMNTMKRQKDRTLKDELPKLVGAQYATGNQWRSNSRKNEGMEPKQQQHPVVDVTGDGSKVLCYKKQYCSLQHQNLLPSPVASTTGRCFRFGSDSSFFLEIFLHCFPIA